MEAAIDRVEILYWLKGEIVYNFISSLSMAALEIYFGGCQWQKWSKPGRGVSEKVSAVGFCLGSGLFGSCNSN